MPKTYDGQISSTGLKIAVIAGRFNGFLVEQLVQGAIDAVVRTGGNDEDISVYRCPGAFEIPQVLRRVIAKGGVDAIVCVGAVIRGATPHFEYVAGAVARGIESAAAETSIPVSFGVLTTDTIEQAIERCGTKAGNKGFEAAMSAVEMVRLFQAIAKG